MKKREVYTLLAQTRDGRTVGKTTVVYEKGKIVETRHESFETEEEHRDRMKRLSEHAREAYAAGG